MKIISKKITIISVSLMSILSILFSVVSPITTYASEIVKKSEETSITKEFENLVTNAELEPGVSKIT